MVAPLIFITMILCIMFFPTLHAVGQGTECMNGTSVENFSCVIYNISFMNCTWNVGRNAPEDTQYFLYLLYSKEEDELKCPHYIKDALGRHIACSFQNVKIVKEAVYFRVNGSSKKSEIQFYDENIKLYEIEKLTPPLNISVNCFEVPPECTVRWKRPPVSHSEEHIDKCFKYQINIQNKKTNANPKESSGAFPMVQETNYKISNFNVTKKYVQIRAKGDACLISSEWGEWSEPIEIGIDADDAVLIVEIVLLLIALGTLLVALVLFFLCKRYCSLKKMFSPIPQPKNNFDDLLQLSNQNTQLEWMDVSPTKYETEEITTIEEIK